MEASLRTLVSKLEVVGLICFIHADTNWISPKEVNLSLNITLDFVPKREDVLGHAVVTKTFQLSGMSQGRFAVSDRQLLSTSLHFLVP